MLKVIHIVGARPQFIKAAALNRAMKKSGQFHEVIVHTGQHFDANMSDVFFDEMEIPRPGYHFDIHSLSHGAMTGQMLTKIEEVLLAEKPDKVIVYGDTNSTLAGALAAAKLHIPVCHVEAGLRSFNMRMPEEINRILTDRVSTHLFCPTPTAVSNLEREGYVDFADCNIHLSGDVMQDAALYYAAKAEQKSRIMKELNPGAFYLCTLHRAENTDDPVRFAAIIRSLNKIHKEVKVIMPVHPRTRKRMKDTGVAIDFVLIDPVGYFDMIELLKHCALVLTDSGGLQKEAFFFRKYCVTLRDETEWTELLEHGFNTLAGADEARIDRAVDEMKNGNSDFSMDLYGSGKASEKIAGVLLA